MQQDINLVIEDFKDSIISMINNAGLPISVVAYILNDINKDVQISYHNYIQQARAAAAQQNVEIPAEEDKED